jgi:hypothetical protein
LLETGAVNGQEAVTKATAILQLARGQNIESLQQQQQQQQQQGPSPVTDRRQNSLLQSPEEATPLIGLADTAVADTALNVNPHAIDAVTSNDILSLGQLLQSRFTPGGVLSQLNGIMTLANVMWVFGALGIAVFFLPAISPFVMWLATKIGPIVMFIVYVLMPFYGLLFYSLALYIIVAAARCGF